MSALSVEDEVYNTVIDGHDEETAGDDGEGMLEGTQPSSSKVPEMTPEEEVKSVLSSQILLCPC